jgi:hypothetical protein
MQGSPPFPSHINADISLCDSRRTFEEKRLYKSGLRNPARTPNPWAIRAISAAQSGAVAVVPAGGAARIETTVGFDDW